MGVRSGAVLSPFLRSISLWATRYLERNRTFRRDLEKLTFNAPSEVELPVEAAPGHVARRNVLEGVVADDVDDGADDGLSILANPREQRLEPLLGALAVSVEECDHLALDVLGSQKSGPYQTRSFLRSEHERVHRQRLDVVLEFLAQIICKHVGKIIFSWNRFSGMSADDAGKRV